MKATVFLLLAGQALAMTSPSSLKLSTRKYKIESLAEGLRDSIIDMRQRRQLSTSTSEIGFMSLSGQNATQWDKITQNTCTESIKALKTKISNPSGMAICYNLPFLDAKTGVFEADLRVFMVAPQTGSFSNIATDKIQVGLSYNGATVSPINKTSVVKRMDDDASLLLLPVAPGILATKREVTPTMIQRYGFVGQINKALLPSNPEKLETILAPNVTLSAVDSTGATVTTSLSSDEVKFVTGVFARKDNSPTKALLAPPIQTLVVAPDAPFVVPGLNILIFPIGLIITGFWTIAMIGTIGYGTFGRIQWRERYREAKIRESRGSLKRI